MLRCVICMVHYLFFILRFMIFSTQIAFFTGLLFASIAVIPKIDVGLDQELALPKVTEIKKQLESYIIHLFKLLKPMYTYIFLILVASTVLVLLAPTYTVTALE